MILRSLSTCAPSVAYTLLYRDGIETAYLQATIGRIVGNNLAAATGFFVTRELIATVQYPKFTAVSLTASTALPTFVCNSLVAKLKASDSLVIATLQANMGNFAIDNPTVVNIR